LSTALNVSGVFLLITLLFSSSSCREQRSPECEDFLALSASRRAEEARNYPIDKQIDMHLCAMRQEPPDLELAYQIADRGGEAIPLLVLKLKNTKNEVDQEHLIYVFEVISDKGHLRGRKDVIATISDVVDAMKIAPVKEDSQESLKKIRINSGLQFNYVQ
jgi:hypothetical protein